MLWFTCQSTGESGMLFFEQTLNSTSGRSQRIYTEANEMSPLRST